MKKDNQNAPLSDEEIEVRLWDYIDGISNREEKLVIEQLIAENTLWREKYAELLKVHQLIDAAELEQPSMRFAKNVMEEIAKHQIAPATREYINKKIIWGIAAFFIIAIVGFLVYAFANVDWSANDTNQYTTGIELTKVNYNKIFTATYINAFIMLNAVLGLILLDSYLTNKNKRLSKEA